MSKPLTSYRRIDQLKTIAYACGFTNEDAKQFGKLSKTATWQALLEARDIPSQVADTVSPSLKGDSQPLDTRDWTSDASFPVCHFTPQNSINFLDWVDFGQLVAFAIASVGVSVLLLNLWPRINPLNLFPQNKITVEVGGSK